MTNDRTAFQSLMAPRSVAIIGASEDGNRIGGRPIKHMLKLGFEGEIFPVNPTRPTIQGLPAYVSMDDIASDVDLAIIAVKRDLVLPTLRQAAGKKTRNAIIYSSGFAETDAEGARLQAEMVQFAARNGIRLLGPNCLGVMNSANGFCASFSSAVEQITIRPGGLAFVSQSGAYGGHMVFMAHKLGLGATYWVTTGNECDLSVGELIGDMAETEDVHTIAAYAESFSDVDTLVASLEKARENRKPVIMMKVGRSAAGAEAASSHTAALASDDAICDAVLRQYGAYRVNSTEEMLDVARACRPRVYPVGNRLGLVTISGGAGVIMADAAAARDLTVAPMPEAAQAELSAMVPFANTRNPVDVTAQFINQPHLIPQFLGKMADVGNYDGMVGFWTFTAGDPTLSPVLLEAIKGIRFTNENCIFIQCLDAPADIIAGYEEAGFPCFADPTRAVNAMAALMQLGANFDKPADVTQIPPPHVPLPDGPLGEKAAKAVLAQAGLPMVEDRLVTSAAQAEAASAAFNAPLAMKIASADIAHKSDIGGVMLNVTGAQAARSAYDMLCANAARHAPDARVDGVLISPMIADGVECILGAQNDPVFGPVVMVGLGGIFAEVLKDVTFRRAPVSPQIAAEMIEELKGVALLKGARGTDPVDLGALAQAISDLSHFAKSHEATIDSVEMNPVRVRAEGCVALDALIVRKTL